jgi:AraC-like DNA-binding protein
MADNFIRYGFDKVINVEKVITLFYIEFSKSFTYDGETHDFWEMVYVDRGEAICTAEKNQFVLNGGELTFHKPNEFHAIRAGENSAPNVSIITFECKSRAMKYFEGKIIRLSAEEKALIGMLFKEGLSAFSLVDKKNPLLQRMEKLTDAPFGSSQMTKNLLEMFLIKLSRKTDVLTKKMRRSYVIDGVDVPYYVKEIVDYLHGHVYNKISVRDVAQAMGKSESTVKKLFSRYRKAGIMKYYSDLKINEAKALIRQGAYNMTQISDMLHFDNPQYFSKCFKAATNMTPSEYKASIMK